MEIEPTTFEMLTQILLYQLSYAIRSIRPDVMFRNYCSFFDNNAIMIEVTTSGFEIFLRTYLLNIY